MRGESCLKEPGAGKGTELFWGGGLFYKLSKKMEVA